MMITVTLDAALEKVMTVRKLAAGHVCRADSTRLEPGGMGLRTTAALHALGVRTAAVGVAGGAAGEYIRDRLESSGVSSDLLLSRAESRTSLRLEDAAHSTATRVEEPETPVTARELREVRRKVGDLAGPGDTVVFSGPMPDALTEELLTEWIHELKQAGAGVALEAAALPGGLPAGAFLLQLTPDALSQACGKRLRGQTALLRAARQVAAAGGAQVVVPGPESVLFADRDAAFLARGTAEDPARLLAGILAGLEAGLSLEQTAARVLPEAALEALS